MCWYHREGSGSRMTEDSLSMLDQRDQRQHQEGEREVPVA